MMKWWAALAPDAEVYANRVSELERAMREDPEDLIARFLTARAAATGRADA